MTEHERYKQAFAALDTGLSPAQIRAAAEAEGLEWGLERVDVFPATENDEALQSALEAACRRAALPYEYLAEPFRWSEDFGCYGTYVPACFFGVGAGPETAPLHTEAYQYPDELAPRTAELFFKLAQTL
jgi:metal-dependent amidase/aminoacylase/carboxypeptidase family protein